MAYCEFPTQIQEDYEDYKDGDIEIEQSHVGKVAAVGRVQNLAAMFDYTAFRLAPDKWSGDKDALLKSLQNLLGRCSLPQKITANLQGIIAILQSPKLDCKALSACMKATTIPPAQSHVDAAFIETANLMTNIANFLRKNLFGALKIDINALATLPPQTKEKLLNMVKNAEKAADLADPSQLQEAISKLTILKDQPALAGQVSINLAQTAELLQAQLETAPKQAISTQGLQAPQHVIIQQNMSPSYHAALYNTQTQPINYYFVEHVALLFSEQSGEDIKRLSGNSYHIPVSETIEQPLGYQGVELFQKLCNLTFDTFALVEFILKNMLQYGARKNNTIRKAYKFCFYLNNVIVTKDQEIGPDTTGDHLPFFIMAKFLQDTAQWIASKPSNGVANFDSINPFYILLFACGTLTANFEEVNDFINHSTEFELIDGNNPNSFSSFCEKIVYNDHSPANWINNLDILLHRCQAMGPGFPAAKELDAKTLLKNLATNYLLARYTGRRIANRHYINQQDKVIEQDQVIKKIVNLIGPFNKRLESTSRGLVYTNLQKCYFDDIERFENFDLSYSNCDGAVFCGNNIGNLSYSSVVGADFGCFSRSWMKRELNLKKLADKNSQASMNPASIPYGSQSFFRRRKNKNLVICATTFALRRISSKNGQAIHGNYDDRSKYRFATLTGDVTGLYMGTPEAIFIAKYANNKIFKKKIFKVKDFFQWYERLPIPGTSHKEQARGVYLGRRAGLIFHYDSPRYRNVFFPESPVHRILFDPFR